ncbi:hypothetical protein PGH07_07960 [Sulfurovum sp. zt1-1]|uniref:Uncharacterized protein n=1 Tax=Sulfurovum zhangzhouensis TaxID=3019067 RepID=A0ABT7QZ47_9BACT|nr:hypothetical protein [Sulfurovum zhangzhouensis]MDM5272112.1 hypothetical protein [Sulfurovum zhangzhouensis]
MIYKRPRIILHQRYYNHRAKRIEILKDVNGPHMITDHGKVHQDYFNEFYEMIGISDAE